MDQELMNAKRMSAEKYAKLAVIFGVISLAGILCCFPLMPVIGGLGIIFAIISRGGSEEYSKEAGKGLTFSIIGTVASLLLTVGLAGYSVYYTMNELKTNEQLYDNIGTEMPPEMEEMLDRLEEKSREYRDK